MDIFSRIDEQASTSDTMPEKTVAVGEIIEKDGKFGYRRFVDQTKYDAEYNVFHIKQRCIDQGFFAERRADKLYKLLLKPQKICDTQKEYEKRKAKRTKKIIKILEKGVNFDKYFSFGMCRAVLEKLSEQDIKLLYQYGFDIEPMLAHVYDTQGVLSKKIYYGISKIDTYILRHIPTQMLETLIHTRENLEIPQSTIDYFVGNFYCNTAERSVKNIQLLIKTGRIYLTAEQIIKFCDFADKEDIKLSPEVEALKKIAQTQLPQSQAEGVDKKYTTQRHLVRKQDQQKKAEQKKKSEAQEAIDKLFEEAQKTTE